MPILRRILGKRPTAPRGRVRNYIANRHLGAAQTDIHENVLNPGAYVPFHTHTVEEVIIVLEGQGEYLSDAGVEAYAAGDVLIIPAGTKHALRCTGDRAIRQFAVFPGDPGTVRLEPEPDGQTVEVFNQG